MTILLALLATTVQAATTTKTYTILDSAALGVLLDGVQRVGDREVTRLLCEKDDADNAPIPFGNINCYTEDISDDDDVDVEGKEKDVVTTEMWYEPHKRDVDFYYDWAVEDMLDNAPLLGECNCDLSLHASLSWSVSGGKATFVVDDLGASDVALSCGSCPCHTFAVALLRMGEITKEALGGTGKKIKGKNKTFDAYVQEQISLKKSALGKKTNVVTGSVKLLDLWIEDDELHARFEYEVK